MKPNLLICNCNPQLDPWQRDTGGVTRTKVFVDLGSGDYGVEQDCNNNSTPSDEWHSIVRTFEPDYRPDEDITRGHLESEFVIELVENILDGSEVIWDGSNHIGKMDEFAKTSFEVLQNSFAQIPENEYTIKTVEDFVEEEREGYNLTALTSDKDLDDMAFELATWGLENKIILNETILPYLQRLREEAEKVG